MPEVDLNAPSAGDLIGSDTGPGSIPGTDMGRSGRHAAALYKSGTKPVMQPPKTRYEIRRTYLDIDRQTWRAHWLEIKNYFLPYRSRWLDDGGLPNRGQKKTQFITDSHTVVGLRILASGLMAGMTNPSRPWFRLKTENPALYELPGVAEWCEHATEKILEILARSNFYRAMPTFYREIGGFGTAALGIYEIPFDPRMKRRPLVNCVPYTIGEYWIAQNEFGVVDTWYRLFKWTVRQVIYRFVREPFNPDHPDWKKIAPSTRAMWIARKWENWIDVINVIEPNEDWRPGALGVAGKQFRSTYYERGGNPFQLLDVRGYDSMPVHVARWDTNSDNVWGNSPAMDALPDAKQLMLQQKRKAQAIDKIVDPPMLGDAGIKKIRVSQLPGDVNWIETAIANTFGIKPLYDFKPDLKPILEDLQEVTKRIDDALYTSVFKMLTSMSDQLKSGITATEIQARQQEKLLELGPLLDRLNGELYEPTIDQVFDVAVARSRMSWQYLQAGARVPDHVEVILAPPPPALSGQKLAIEYVSILAQAMRTTEIQAIQQLVAFAIGAYEKTEKIEILDKIDFDKAIDITGDRLSAPPEVIVSEDKVKEIRKQRAQAAQQQQQHEQAVEAAQAAAKAIPAVGGPDAAVKFAQQMQAGGQPQQQEQQPAAGNA